jgi:hypothetical protein
MTKKRFKLGIMALGVLAAFLMTLTALLLAPTLASTGKISGTGHQYLNGHNGDGSKGNPGGSPDPIYFEHPDGHGTEKAYWNALGDSGGPCAGAARDCSGQNETPGTRYINGDSSTNSSGTGGSSSGTAGGNPKDGNGNGSGNGFPGGFFAGGYSSGGGGSGGSGGSSGNGNSSGNPGPAGTDPDIQPFISVSDPGTGSGPGTPPPDFGNSPFTDPPNSDGTPEGDPPTLLTDTHPVPEPLTVSLFAVGLAGSAAMRRRSKAK